MVWRAEVVEILFENLCDYEISANSYILLGFVSLALCQRDSEVRLNKIFQKP